MLLAIKNKHKQVISEQGLSGKFNITIENDKALSLGSYLLSVNDLIKLEDNALLISKDYSGTILESLLADKDNTFWNLLIERLYDSFKYKYIHFPPVKSIEKILEYFILIAKKDDYIESFSKLGYWKLDSFNNEPVVELHHKEDHAELLLLYFKQQELVIAMAVKNPGFILSLKDNRVQNLLHAIMLNSEEGVME